MTLFTNKAVVTGNSNASGLSAARMSLNFLINMLIKFGILKEDIN
jgi:hypothetical protein